MNPIDTYARAVLAGTVPAGTYHRLACARHVRDRERENTAAFPYVLQYEKAERFIRFAEKLKHYKGEWAGQPIQLQPHQQFRLGSIFAWVHRETGLRRFRTAYNEIPRKNGKAIALDTPVPTPTGWINHGDLQIGDSVFNAEGQPVRVEWVGPIESGPCFRLTVSTGESIVAHAHHEWITARTWYTGRPKGFRTEWPLPPVETQQIATTLRCGSRGDYVHRIPVAAPLDLAEAILPIPPYTLGAWLGDGTSGSGSITVADEEIIDRIRQEGIDARPVSRKSLATLYRLDGHQGSQDSFTSRLRAAGVLGAKRIPAAYLRASYAQRLEILRGIVDTDGYVSPKGVYEVVSVSAVLADDIRELIHTLGLKSTLLIDRAQLDGRDYGPRYRIGFSAHSDQVATVPRKISRWKPAIKRRSRARTITRCDPCETVDTSCIQVEGGIYLVGRDFIQTHNSLEAAVVALYVTFFDGEAGAEGYCIATKREQAKVVFNDAKRLVKQSGLRSRIEGSQHKLGSLYRADTACKLEALGADSDSTDGLNPNLIINDEYHAQKDREMLDVMETATGARRQPRGFQITTAGSDLLTPCGYQHDYACKVLDQVLVDETFFCFIAHADPDDDWTEEATWRKANPNYSVSVRADDLRSLATKARHMEPAVAAFKQKRLNLWVNAIAPWLSLDGWRHGQSQWSTDDVRGQPCTIGIDLSSKIDLAAMVIRFPPTATRRSTRLIIRALTPEETLAERARRDHAPYELWVRDGWLSTTPGSRIDQAVLRAWVAEARARYRVTQIGIDPWNAGNLVTELDQEGLQPIEIPQNIGQMSGPAKDFEADVLEGLVDSGGNPLMQWCVSNAVVMRDNKDNIYPIKKKSRGRIDPVVAALLAHKVGMVEVEPPKQYQAFAFGPVSLGGR